MSDNREGYEVSKFDNWPHNICFLNQEQYNELDDLLFGAHNQYCGQYDLAHLRDLINVDPPLYLNDDCDRERIQVMLYVTTVLNDMPDIDLQEVLFFYQQHGTKQYPVKTSILKILTTSTLPHVKLFFDVHRELILSLRDNKVKYSESFQDPDIIAQQYCNNLHQLLLDNDTESEASSDVSSDDDIYA